MDIDYNLWIGRKVQKLTLGKGKPKPGTNPFKSGLKVNTVTGIIDHPILHIPAFTFAEDSSYVECRRCTLAQNIEGQQVFENLGMADLDTVLPQIDTTFDVVHFKAKRDFTLFGVGLRVNTTRLIAHKLNGCRCGKCGLEAGFFAVERIPGEPSWHLNLYSDDGLLFHAALKDEFPSDAPNAIKADPKNFDTLCHGCFKPRKNEHHA